MPTDVDAEAPPRHREPHLSRRHRERLENVQVRAAEQDAAMKIEESRRKLRERDRQARDKRRRERRSARAKRWARLRGRLTDHMPAWGQPVVVVSLVLGWSGQAQAAAYLGMGWASVGVPVLTEGMTLTCAGLTMAAIDARHPHQWLLAATWANAALAAGFNAAGHLMEDHSPAGWYRAAAYAGSSLAAVVLWAIVMRSRRQKVVGRNADQIARWRRIRLRHPLLARRAARHADIANMAAEEAFRELWQHRRRGSRAARKVARSRRRLYPMVWATKERLRAVAGARMGEEAAWQAAFQIHEAVGGPLDPELLKLLSADLIADRADAAAHMADALDALVDGHQRLASAFATVREQAAADPKVANDAPAGGAETANSCDRPAQWAVAANGDVSALEALTGAVRGNPMFSQVGTAVSRGKSFAESSAETADDTPGSPPDTRGRIRQPLRTRRLSGGARTAASHSRRMTVPDDSEAAVAWIVRRAKRGDATSWQQVRAYIAERRRKANSTAGAPGKTWCFEQLNAAAEKQPIAA